MKPFDIEKAKAGHPVCTRDGRKVRIICFDKIGTYPIMALILEEGVEMCHFYTKDGKCVDNRNNYDLMMLPKKKERWLNVYHNEKGEYWSEQVLFSTKEEAIDFVHDRAQYVTTVKIEWEE